MNDSTQAIVNLLTKPGIRLERGLTATQIERAQEIYEVRFPPDLRELLENVLPLDPPDFERPRFPDWRDENSDTIRMRLEWPLDGLLFDVERNGFWLEEWGDKPLELEQQFAIARDAVNAAPRLIPIWGHRFLPSEPHERGNPVLSVMQTDIIVYGRDLLSYFQNELGHKYENIEPTRPIRFWDFIMFGE